MNAIQQQRMKGYFIAAAKELIRGEGLEVVSARNVAQRAGYSYATLYNYFKDIRDLIFSCVEDFMAECARTVHQEVPKNLQAQESIIEISKSYARFFIQYPGIFELFFQTKVSRIATAQSNIASVENFFQSLVARDWEAVREKRRCSEEQVAHAGQLHCLALHGLLMFFLNGRSDGDYAELMNRITKVSESAFLML